MEDDLESQRLRRDARQKLPGLERATRELQERAARMRAEGDPLLEETERALELSRRLEGITRDIASGERERLSARMTEGVAAALGSGAPEDWEEAMDRISVWALDASRPAAFAGAVLDALGEARIPAAAYARVVGPINFERSASTPGYEWVWHEDDADERSAKAAWARAERRASGMESG